MHFHSLEKKSGFEVSGFKLTTCFFYGKFLLIGTSIRDGMGQFFSFFLYFTWVGLGRVIRLLSFWVDKFRLTTRILQGSNFGSDVNPTLS